MLPPGRIAVQDTNDKLYQDLYKVFLESHPDMKGINRSAAVNKLWRERIRPSAKSKVRAIVRAQCCSQVCVKWCLLLGQFTLIRTVR